MKKWINTFVAALLPFLIWGQDQSVEMADTMRSNGKIYVVVAVILIIFIGMIVYMVRMDRKISAIEKRQQS